MLIYMYVQISKWNYLTSESRSRIKKQMIFNLPLPPAPRSPGILICPGEVSVTCVWMTCVCCINTKYTLNKRYTF